MKFYLFLAVVLGLGFPFRAGSQQPLGGEVRLLVREDDMGSFHAANLACIECYTNGIARSVELMVNGPWFPEAVKLLRENPGLDVGVHLVLTSEWESLKWGPKTWVPGLVDSNGFFFPMVWRNSQFPLHTSIQEANWQLPDIEKELRAQIEIALRNVPRITHLGGHMGFEGLDVRIRDLVERLRREYRLQPGEFKTPIKYFPGWGRERSTGGRITAFINNLIQLKPGTYLFIEHPAQATAELESVGHKSYENVRDDRDAVRQVYTSPEVKEAIRKLNIKLISYAELR